MSVEFWRTVMGRHYYEHTLPALVDQLRLLNHNVERLTSALLGRAGDTSANAPTTTKASE